VSKLLKLAKKIETNFLTNSKNIKIARNVNEQNLIRNALYDEGAFQVLSDYLLETGKIQFGTKDYPDIELHRHLAVAHWMRNHINFGKFEWVTADEIVPGDIFWAYGKKFQPVKEVKPANFEQNLLTIVLADDDDSWHFRPKSNQEIVRLF